MTRNHVRTLLAGAALAAVCGFLGAVILSTPA